MQAQVETLLARKMIANEINEGDRVEVYYDKEIKGLNIREKIDKEKIETNKTVEVQEKTQLKNTENGVGEENKE